MKLTIKRSEWYRGNGALGSMLLRPEDGKKCCVGFYALACGLAPSTVEGVSMLVPELIKAEVPEAAQWMTGDMGSYRLSLDAKDIYEINDNSMGCSESEREEKLTALFAKHDVQLEFVD